MNHEERVNAVERIIRANAQINAFVRPEQLASMAGIPPTAPGILSRLLVGVKDNIAITGQPLTAGMAARESCIAPKDANAVKRMRAAGALVLGGLNMDEAALGATTDNPGFGRTLNPLDRTRSAGGSSGGAAAAVAAGLVDLALGSDTMGSVRIPAAYCGIWGLKPTRGRVGRSGVHPLAPSLDTLGLFARDCAGLEVLLSVLTGPDPEDPASRPVPQVSDPRAISELWIGVPEFVLRTPCDQVMSHGMARAQEALRRLSARVVPLDMTGWDAAALEAATFLWTETEGAKALADDLERPGGVSPGMARMLDFGRRVSSAKLVDARESMDAGCAALDRAFAAVDLILTPTTPYTAFAFDQPVPAHQAVFTALANVAGIPALAIPVAGPDQVLPGSVQLMGPHWSEPQLFAVASALSEAN